MRSRTCTQMAKGELLGTFILNDPLGLSYLQNLYAPDPDPNMTVTEYERSYDDNEAFGLNDMNTDHYTTHTDDDRGHGGGEDSGSGSAAGRAGGPA
jgi:zinc finger protein